RQAPVCNAGACLFSCRSDGGFLTVGSNRNHNRVTLDSTVHPRGAMSPELYIEEDTCELCFGPVAILLERDRGAGGILLRPIVQRIRCLNDCLGPGVLSQSRLNLH